LLSFSGHTGIIYLFMSAIACSLGTNANFPII
jgi:hypothetical protein